MAPKWHGPIAGAIAAAAAAVYTLGVDPGWHVLDHLAWAMGLVFVIPG